MSWGSFNEKAAARRIARREDLVPPGWTREAYRVYREDAEGGRSPVRLPYPDLTPTAAEIESRFS